MTFFSRIAKFQIAITHFGLTADRTQSSDKDWEVLGEEYLTSKER